MYRKRLNGTFLLFGPDFVGAEVEINTLPYQLIILHGYTKDVRIRRVKIYQGKVRKHETNCALGTSWCVMNSN